MAKKNNPPVPTPRSNPVAQQGASASATQTTQISAQLSQFEGPIPPPTTLLGYETIKTGFAERIMGWAETQGNFRRRVEWRAQTIDAWKEFAGMLLIFFLAAMLIAGSIWLLHDGKQMEGFASLGVTAVSFAWAIRGRKPRT